MRIIYYCNKCGFVGSEEDFKPVPACPDCKIQLQFTGISRDEWRSKTTEEKQQIKSSWNKLLSDKCLEGDSSSSVLSNHLLTTGINFEGYKITKYHGIVSGEAVLGTGFLSELSASVDDFFGNTSNAFSNKMKSAKDIATNIMVSQSIANGGNATIGINFGYITIGKNMFGVSVNGTSVTIEKE